MCSSEMRMTPRPLPGRKQPSAPLRTKLPTVRTETPQRSATSSIMNGPCWGGFSSNSRRQSASKARASSGVLTCCDNRDASPPNPCRAAIFPATVATCRQVFSSGFGSSVSGSIFFIQSWSQLRYWLLLFMLKYSLYLAVKSRYKRPCQVADARAS